MKLSSLILVFATVSTSFSYAQSSMLSGKIVDENNQPLAGAKIEVRRAGVTMAATSDGDGLFYTRLLSVGNYHLGVVVNGKYKKSKSVYLPDETKKRSYYYLRVVGDRVIVAIDGQDPFLKAKLSKLDENDPRKTIDMPGNSFRISVDSAGKVKNALIPPGRPPRVSEAW